MGVRKICTKHSLSVFTDAYMLSSQGYWWMKTPHRQQHGLQAPTSWTQIKLRVNHIWSLFSILPRTNSPRIWFGIWVHRKQILAHRVPRSTCVQIFFGIKIFLFEAGLAVKFNTIQIFLRKREELCAFFDLWRNMTIIQEERTFCSKSRSANYIVLIHWDIFF